MTIVPREPGLTAVFVLPEGITPARSNFPGVVVRGRWRVVYIGVPPEGVTWRASFKAGLGVAAAGHARRRRVAALSRRRSGWQSPARLAAAAEHGRGTLDVAWDPAAPPAPIAPVPPLR